MTRRYSFAATLAAACAGLALTAARPLRAQDVRVSGTTTVNYVELRPLQMDSVLAATTTGDGVIRLAPDGRTVQCVDPSAYCYLYSNGSAISSAPALQDLQVSAWGFGQGMRFYADLRGRAVVNGSNTLWPQANDHFDALEAYLEFERPRVRVRAGRQWDVSGLAFNNYDGASVQVRPMSTLSVEAYGGWTLQTGLDEPVTSGALAAVEPYAPDSRGLLFGLRAQARPAPPVWLSAVYERSTPQSGSGLYSERMAADGMFRSGRLTMDLAAQIDLASADLNELRTQLLYVPDSRWTVRAFVRRHQPYFDLWTIWGAFGAVGFVEGGAGASWRSTDGALSVDGQASRRHYLNTDAEVGFAPIRSNGWSLSGSGAMRLSPVWALDAQYGLDLGFGAAKSQGGLTLRRALRGGNSVGLTATAFQTADELRVNSGTVVGLGVNGVWRLGERSTITGSVADYQHAGRVPDSGPNWSQLRASLTYNWTVGAEPGLPAPGGR